MPIERVRRAFLPRLPLAERTEILSVLRDETTGGFVLLVATAAALLWANLGTESYLTVSETVIGPASLHLDLSVAAWTADALLAVFFLVALLRFRRSRLSSRRPKLTGAGPRSDPYSPWGTTTRRRYLRRQQTARALVGAALQR